MSDVPYDDYQETGIPWLPELPSHWTPARLKHVLLDMLSGGTPDSGNESYWAYESEGIPWVAIGDMTKADTLVSTEKQVSSLGLAVKKLPILPKGTLLYSIYASLGKVAVLGVSATTNQAILGLVPNAKRLNERFLFYWLKDWERFLGLFASSNTQNNLNAEKVSNFSVALPPLPEQKQIASFLDYETAKIDALIEKQQQLIALLGEKRQAVISHAVTKGLNPDAPMRDSGVEWLGEVPEHWQIVPLKRLVVLQRGHDLPTDERREGTYPILSSAGRIGFHDEFKARGPGIVTGRYGTIGEFYIETEDYWPLNTSLYSIECHQNHVPFLLYMLRNMKHLFVLNSLKTAVPGVDRNDVHSEYVAAPVDLEEQIEIADFIHAKMDRFDDLVLKAEDGVQLLRERRTALISAAVTGKIDVRDWKPPSSSANRETEMELA